MNSQHGYIYRLNSVMWSRDVNIGFDIRALLNIMCFIRNNRIRKARH